MSFEQSFQNLLGWEGGYGNNAKDPGGPTNLGVIQSEYDTYRASKGLSIQSVKQITIAEAEDIYKREYWDATLCDQLNPGLANCLFDADVNSGDRRGVEWLQKAINEVSKGAITIAVDGRPGTQTMTAAASFPVDALIDTLLATRLAFMKVARNPKTGALLWPTFGRGWFARINGVRLQSHKLAGIEPATAPQTFLETTMEVSMTAAPSASAPVVTTPASAFGVLISPLVNLATQIATGIGAAIFANGGQQVVTKMLDPNTGAFAALANGNLLLGALLAGASYYVSHKLVTGSNSATISALTPQPPSNPA